MLNTITLPRIQQASIPDTGGSQTSSGFMPPLNWRSGTVRKQLSVRQQLASFHGWNYIRVHLIGKCLGTIFPKVGRLKQLGPGQVQSISRDDRRILQHAGVYVADGQDWQSLQAHPLIDLMRKPSPERDATWTKFAYEVHVYWQLCGQAWIWKVPNGFGAPGALWPIPNDWIHPKDNVPGVYIIENGMGGQFEVPEAQLMRGRFPDPLNKNGAYSPTQAIAPWLMSAEAIDAAQYQSFSTDIYADWALLLDKDAYPTVDTKSLELFKEIFMERAAGVHNMGALPMPPGVRDMKQLRNKPMEMNFRESGNYTRDEILAGSQINKFSAGISEDMNRGDTAESQTAFWTNVGDPLNVFWADVLTCQLAKDFDPNLVVAFPSGRPIDRDQELKEDMNDFDQGALSPDELALKRGRRPLNTPESRTRYVKTTVIPLDTELRPDPVVSDAVAVMEDENSSEGTSEDDAEDDAE